MALNQPRKEAHRKVRKGKNRGTASRCNTVAFGDFGLVSLDNERVNGRQKPLVRLSLVTSNVVVKSGSVSSRIFLSPRNLLMSRWEAAKVNHNSTSLR